MPVYPFVLAGSASGSGGGAGGFAGLAHEDDHSGFGLARMLEQYAETPRLRGLLEIFLDGETTIGGSTGPTGVQSIEDLGWELYTERFLHVVEGSGPAEGVNLDVIGRIVGQERLEIAVGADSVYITLLKGRIYVNRTNGRIEELLELLGLLGISEAIDCYDWDGCVRVVATDVDADPMAEAIWALLSDAAPAGVRLELVFSTSALADGPFMTSSQVGADDSSTTQGTSNLAGATGGNLAGMFS